MSNKPPVSRKTDVIIWIISMIVTAVIAFGIWSMLNSEQSQLTNAQTQSHELPVTPNPEFEARQIRNSHSYDQK